MSQNEQQTPEPVSVPARVAASKTPIRMESRGIVLGSMDELARFAQTVCDSGLAPKGLTTPQAVAIAVQMGLEVGLSPMAALQNIAVINGRPTIWGDAMLAVCRNTGEMDVFSEWYESGGVRVNRSPSKWSDADCAVCLVKRAGQEEQETSFSVSDAKLAGLWGKAGPWTQYPARMLRFRARSFALRDQFGDALRGLTAAEEALDEPINVTPRPAFTAAPEVQP